VLDIRPIGVETNFFDLGEHSMLATKVLTRIRETFSLNVPLRAMFDSPTVAGVAAYIEKAGAQREVTSIAEMLEKLAQLSDDETRSLLQEEEF